MCRCLFVVVPVNFFSYLRSKSFLSPLSADKVDSNSFQFRQGTSQLHSLWASHEQCLISCNWFDCSSVSWDIPPSLILIPPILLSFISQTGSSSHLLADLWSLSNIHVDTNSTSQQFRLVVHKYKPRKRNETGCCLHVCVLAPGCHGDRAHWNDVY